MHRRNQSFYSRIAKNDKIENILINVFLMFKDIDFLVINFINVVLAKKLASL
jgi:hypothetical protein